MSAGLQIFLREKVDVAVLEVGLGGRLDATNVVREPYVCGISSLGYDHMEILGHTLPEIAGEKAGILKQGAPAFTVQQPTDAMQVLQVTFCPAWSVEGLICEGTRCTSAFTVQH